MKKATLKEVADLCNVSRQTVTRILSGKAHLHKQETVEKVKAAAEQVGYRPNLMAKIIRGSATPLVGLFNFKGGDFINSLQNYTQKSLLDKNSIPIIVMQAGSEKVEEAFNRLLDLGVTGIISKSDFWNYEATKNLAKKAETLGVPFVAISELIEETPSFDVVGTDEYAGGNAAAHYLLENGHRNICILEPIVDKDRAILNRRTKTFKDHINSTEGTTLTNVYTDYKSDDYLQITEILSRPKDERPTAIFAITDDLALKVYRAAYDLNLRIPDDISVLGYADNTYSQQLAPPLCSVRQETELLASQAVELLQDRIDKKINSPEKLEHSITPTLMKRDSVKSI